MLLFRPHEDSSGVSAHAVARATEDAARQSKEREPPPLDGVGDGT